jgi:small nuclear ribonucleoprotein D3
MAPLASSSVGVPILLLHEGQGHVVTVEMKTGEVYRGKLTEAEDTMNCAISDVTVTARDGKTTRLERVYLRGSHVKFMILPEILKNAPIFKGVQKAAKGYTGQRFVGVNARGRGRGRGGGRGRAS